MSRYLTLGLGAAAMLFAVLSARLGVPYLAYGVVACAVAAVVLCAWDKLDWKTAPYLVFLLGLAFLYQTTLLSNTLVGTDIHTEYYMYQKALNGWDWSYHHPYNTAIGATVMAPALTGYLGIPGEVTFKVIYPFLFAFVPLLLFAIYRKEFGDKVAFLSCVLFITIPTYLLEMIGLPRQMLGELMLALAMVLIILRPMRNRYLVTCLVACSTLGYLFHYVMGPIILLMVGICAAVLLTADLVNRHRDFMPRVQFPLRWMTVAVMVPAILGIGYYTVVADGRVASDLKHVFTSTSARLLPGGEDNGTTVPVPHPVTGEDIGADDPNRAEDTEAEDTDRPSGFFHRQEPLVRTALGLDFMEVGAVGKGYRIVQFGVQLSILLGCLWLFRNRKKVSAEFTGFAVAAVVILAACVLLPRFSNIINATRFFHLALFPLSPLVIVGATQLFRNAKVVVLVLLVPYILFNTGAVLEMVKEEDIGKVNAPYSIALSNHRLGAVGVYTDNDVEVSQYARENSLQPILSDINGMLLLSQHRDPFTFFHRDPKTERYFMVTPPTKEIAMYGMSAGELEHGWGYLPQHVDMLPDVCYIFLTERSMQTETVVFKPQWYAPTDTSSGMRTQYPFEFLGLPGGNSEILYRVGDAVILKVEVNNEAG